jgi:two-component system, LytTR family, sensor kinase
VSRWLRKFLWAALLWTALAVVFATQLYFAGLPWPLALAWSIPRWWSWGLITPAVFWLDKRIGRTASLAQRVAIHVPLGLFWTTLSIVLRLITRPLRGALMPPDVAAFFLDRVYSDLLIYAVIAGASMARDYAGQAHERERQAHALALDRARLERDLIESRLHGLRAQLHPHFLFNALNTISAFTETDPPTARRLMGQLGSLLRASLGHVTRPLVTLGEELTFLDDYLGIESARFEGRIVVTVDADDDILDRPVPGFLLQPIVENAIRHGVSPQPSGGRVDVTARKDGAAMVLQVVDDGVGLPGDWTIGTHAGVGLKNVASRLEHLYRRTDLLTVQPRASSGVQVTITIPPQEAAR